MERGAALLAVPSRTRTPAPPFSGTPGALTMLPMPLRTCRYYAVVSLGQQTFASRRVRCSLSGASGAAPAGGSRRYEWHEGTDVVLQRGGASLAQASRFPVSTAWVNASAGVQTFDVPSRPSLPLLLASRHTRPTPAAPHALPLPADCYLQSGPGGWCPGRQAAGEHWARCAAGSLMDTLVREKHTQCGPWAHPLPRQFIRLSDALVLRLCSRVPCS